MDIERIAAALAKAGLQAVRLEDLEYAAMLTALRAQSGNRTYAAETLGIAVRTLQRKLKVMEGVNIPPRRI